MKLEQDLILGMDREKIRMYSDLVEQGKLVDGEAGGHYQVLFCGDVVIKCPYDGCESEYDEHAIRLMRESVVQKDLEVNGKLNVPKWMGYYSGGEERRPFLAMRTRTINPPSDELMPQYLEGMKRIKALGYDTGDTLFDKNHGADREGNSIFHDFTDFVNDDWRLN